MRYPLVIFDLDGTLADSLPWFLRNVNSVAERFSFRRVAEEDIARYRRRVQSRNAVVATCRAMGGAKRYRSSQGKIVSFIAPASYRRNLAQQELRIRQPIGGRQISFLRHKTHQSIPRRTTTLSIVRPRHGARKTSIVRLNDAAIVDGAILAAVGLLLEYHL